MTFFDGYTPTLKNEMEAKEDGKISDDGRIRKKAVDLALDEFEYDGKTIREWTELILNGNLTDVVRCKDCKHRGTDYCIFHVKGEPADEELLKKLDNDFCSYGERREEA